MYIFKGANLYQKVVGQNEAGQGISGFIRQLLPRTYFLKVIFALNRSFLPWIFGAGQKSGSAYALVDLVTLAPLNMMYTYVSGIYFPFFPGNQQILKFLVFTLPAGPLIFFLKTLILILHLRRQPVLIP